MQKLFDEDDDVEETKLQVNKNYARNYEKKCTREEIQKLTAKYGGHLKDNGDEDSSSSEDDEDAHLLTDEIDKQIFKTLAYLKKKDPKIYDSNVEFFPPAKAEDAEEDESNQNEEKKKKKSEKNEKMTLRDYERKILVENGGIFSDDEENEVKPKTKLPYVEEERQLLESIKNVADNIDDTEDDDLLKKKSKTSAEKEEEEEAYKLWLLGQPAEVDDEDKKELKPLRDYWTDPNLDANEKFLRDYVMGNMFSELDDEADDGDKEDGYADRLQDDQDLSEDEKQIEDQEEFEHKYNFRFEEPDPEFIKRYPRTVSDSMRKKDTRRAEKRAEVKKRKEQEKLKEEEERKRYNALKRKEILDRLTRLRDVTGNKDINIEKYGKFLEEDYDPEEYDKLMQNDYGEDYYNQDLDEDAKPEFPDIDEELEIEKSWDNYYPTEDNAQEDTSEAYCEDPDFVMDADYDDNKKAAEEITFKRKRRKRSKFAELMAKKKQEYNPDKDGSFKEYIVKNYALDYEDKVGDNTFRFKYRQVTPNDYGLTVEEIMMADDKELNKWCSLKKALEYKDENTEQRLARIYKQKSLNENFKRKILTSLYKPFEEEVDEEIKIKKELVVGENPDDGEKKKKRKRKKGKKNNDGKNDQAVEGKVMEVNGTETNDKNVVKGEEEVKNKNKKKKKKLVVKEEVDDTAEVIEKKDEVLNEKKKNKKKGQESEVAKVKEEKVASEEINVAKGKKKRKADNLQNGEFDIKEPQAKKAKDGSDGNINKGQKKKKKKNENKTKPTKPHNPIASLSDERLKAYGLNPRKFRNKLKYNKNNEK
ncbi:GSCOCG00005242001-RA-CDS [Cotesia congregata]|uniref:Protein KRI1 homolog n=1 Tax=Cotesia congregata TaxID=51543 RepID=A0A8J2MXI9_COTCN|nr:GSCOCG00005242001-RA-CDS [Cotesia congregata]CAG5101798.1 Similar to CG5645: Protein KRI1 homolog (Drosophila melanogaster) [Cotesia congregata]